MVGPFVAAKRTKAPSSGPRRVCQHLLGPSYFTAPSSTLALR